VGKEFKTYTEVEEKERLIEMCMPALLVTSLVAFALTRMRESFSLLRYFSLP